MIDPLFPLVPSILVAVVVLGVLIFFESRRKLRYTALRIVAQVLLVTSVLLLTLRPAIQNSKSENVLLLTDGYQQSTVDSLQSYKTVSVNSYNELSKLNGVSVIAGNGLPSWALDLLPSKNYSFIPSAAPKGITGIGFDEHIYANRWNTIRCTYHGDETTIGLRGPGGVDDSVKVSNGAFTLSFFAKAPGRFNYELTTPQGNETLPLIIEPEHAFNIIFLNAYPTFEVRYLKNFLASKGHHLAIRNQVSRGLYKFEFANRPTNDFKSLTPTLLEETDLVIVDEGAWHSMSNTEQKNIQTAINNGLGVILLPEAKQLKNVNNLLQFTPTQQKDTTRVSLGRAGSVQLPVLQLETKNPSAILSGRDKRVLSGYIHSGSGKIGYQLLNETYQAGLKGKSEIYSALWVPLLEKTARNLKNDFKLKITSPFPLYENQPVSFDIISSGKVPALTIDNIAYPLTEDVYIDDVWHGTVWLDGNSWHDFTVDSTTTSVHVAKEGSWKSLSAANNRKATSLQAGTNNNSENTVAVKDESTLKIILFSIFVLAAGFIWIAPKL